MEPPSQLSTWAPLRQPLFRALWIAAVASNIGTWMQNVGAAWLMTSLAPSPAMVAAGTGGYDFTGVSGRAPRGRRGRCCRPSASAACDTRLDALCGGATRRFDAPECNYAVAFAPADLRAWTGRGHERAGMAGDHSRAGTPTRIETRGDIEWRRLQRRPRGWTRTGRRRGRCFRIRRRFRA